MLAFIGASFSTTLLVNSLDFTDIISSATYAKANGYAYVFTLDPKQSVFIARYYTSSPDEPIIYVEGKTPVLANMEAILRSSGAKNLTVVKGKSVPEWVADSFPKNEAILVGGSYGQDALSVAPLSALKRSPIFFVDPSKGADEVIESIRSRGYKSTLVYGAIAHQVPKGLLDALPSARTIDTGNRYSNNLQVVGEFLDAKPTAQVMFVSGRTFEKSMVDTSFPLVLAGRSDVLSDASDFIKARGITAGVVFVGDADIVDGVSKLRAQVPSLSLFAKFGEGYTGERGSSVPMPLMVVNLPSPTISLEIVNISYNIPSKAFELRVKNGGDFAVLSSGITVPGAGSSDSPLVMLDPGVVSTIAIPLDASGAISQGKIPEGTLTVRYGEDSALLDNVDTITYKDISVNQYEDNSTMKIISVQYNPDTKSFEIAFDGNGYVEGTLRFSINNIPVTIRVPNSKIAGPTTINVKYLLSNDEQAFVDNLMADYAIRFGSKGDVLLFESKGTVMNTLKSNIPFLPPEAGGPGTSASGGSGIPWALIGGVFLAVAVLAFVFLRSRKGGDGFE